MNLNVEQEVDGLKRRVGKAWNDLGVGAQRSLVVAWPLLAVGFAYPYAYINRHQRPGYSPDAMFPDWAWYQGLWLGLLLYPLLVLVIMWIFRGYKNPSGAPVHESTATASASQPLQSLDTQLRKLGLHLWDLAMAPLLLIGGWRYGKEVGESCETGGIIEGAVVVAGFFIAVVTVSTWWRERKWPLFMSSAVLNYTVLLVGYNLGLDSNQHYYVYIDNQTSNNVVVQIGPYELQLAPGDLKRTAAQHGTAVVVIRNATGAILSKDEIHLHRNDQILINVDAHATYYRGEVRYTTQRYAGLGGTDRNEKPVTGRIIQLDEDYIFIEPPDQISVSQRAGWYTSKTYLRR